MSAPRRNVAGYIIAGIVAIVAVGFAIKQTLLTGNEDAPNTADSSTYWYCAKCAKGFALTASEYHDRVSYQMMPADTDGGRMNRPRATVKCADCGGAAVTARRCPSDGVIFDIKQSPKGCPQCGWNPLAH